MVQEFPSCYCEIDLTDDIVNCLDRAVRNSTTIRTYKNVVDFFERYNDGVVISMNKCIANFTIILNESLAYSKNEFNACIENREYKKMNDSPPKNTDSLTEQYLGDMHSYYIGAIEAVEMKHEDTVAEFQDNTVTYYRNLVNALDNSEINATCCFPSQKMYLQDTAKRTRDGTNECFNNQSAVLEYFVNSTLQVRIIFFIE